MFYCIYVTVIYCSQKLHQIQHWEEHRECRQVCWKGGGYSLGTLTAASKHIMSSFSNGQKEIIPNKLVKKWKAECRDKKKKKKPTNFNCRNN